MTLHLERHGRGPHLVLLHGWGLHGGVWGPLVDRLRHHFRMTLLDLPGHGRSLAGSDGFTLDAVVNAAAEAAPANAIWVGWSLGGLVALSAAAEGVPIAQLVLTGTAARFVSGPDWPHAMPAELLAGFAADLKQDYRRTLNRFLVLQARGSAHAREEIRRLRGELFAHGEPDPTSLEGGLTVLRDTDLRPRLAEIEIPALFLHGERDALVPLPAASATAREIAHAQIVSMAKSAHAPFLSHPDAFASALRENVHA